MGLEVMGPQDKKFRDLGKINSQLKDLQKQKRALEGKI
jgi:hypothetical protein